MDRENNPTGKTKGIVCFNGIDGKDYLCHHNYSFTLSPYSDVFGDENGDEPNDAIYSQRGKLYLASSPIRAASSVLGFLFKADEANNPSDPSEDESIILPWDLDPHVIATCAKIREIQIEFIPQFNDKPDLNGIKPQIKTALNELLKNFSFITVDKATRWPVKGIKPQKLMIE